MKIHRTLSFKLLLASMALALVTIGLGGLTVYKLSEDAIKKDAQRTAQELARELSSGKATGTVESRLLTDALTSLKVEKFGSGWVMDRNGFLLAHMDPKFRNMVEARTYIGDTVVHLNVVDQPIHRLGEKNIVHEARLQELLERFDGGFGTYNFLGNTKILAFRVIKERGWLVAVDQPIGTAFSELTRIKKVIVTTCLVIAVLVFGFTWFAVRIIIRPYYREQEETNRKLALMNRELEASRGRMEKAGNSIRRLYDISIAMQYTGIVESHLPLVLGVLQERFDLDRILLLMPDEAGEFLRCKASVGDIFEGEEKVAVPLSPEGGAISRAFQEKRTFFFDGSRPVPEEFRLSPPHDGIRSLRSKSFAVFPLIAKDTIIGVLGVDNKMSRRPLAREEIEAIESFSYKMASLIENTIHFQALRKTTQEMENRDRLTGMFHIRYARTIGDGFVSAAVRDRIPFTMALLHITNFREYNERNGYQRADFVLQKTADLLKAQAVMGVIPVRCYGTKFLLLFPGKNEDQGRYLVEQFQREFEQFSFYGEKSLAASRLVLKVSLAEYPREEGKSFDEFFAALEEM